MQSRVGEVKVRVGMLFSIGVSFIFFIEPVSRAKQTPIKMYEPVNAVNRL